MILRRLTVGFGVTNPPADSTRIEGKGETKMPQRKTALGFGILFAAALACSQTLGAVTFLRTQGQDMVDESGKKVLLQGVG
jgi:hypothetical protein